MLSTLHTFYKHYPSTLLQLKNISRSSLPADLLKTLDFHGQRQSEILDVAQFYMLDKAAQALLYDLSAKMKKDGLEDMFSHVQLPFPAMLLTVPPVSNGMRPFALITQDEGVLYTQVFLEGNGGFIPNMLIFKSEGAAVDTLMAPTFHLAKAAGDDIDNEVLLEQERPICMSFLSMAVGMSLLFQHKAMLETEEVPLYSRAERRRAQKEGSPLPDKRVVKVTLGELGKRQMQAMQDDHESISPEKRARRAHWVQGHFMRNRAGGLSWRNPHIRGAGPTIEQERHVSAINSKFD
ncbi:hypothetical protein B6V74_12850 [Thioclava sp. F42-5]|uniref:hypothetical protein n=1 Tax=Thioclava sp. F42-5 TaxID=1973005 RepID=UPI000B539736|nr:hypothetical protein [Thioclava sp. F42-5]OWY08709.1 hypothetical protein B6V74_12850 [Thioclava sp. F42-5]